MAVLGTFLKSGIKLTSSIQDSIPVVPFKAQKKTLTKLINKARNTQFGEKYDFDSILNASIFEDGKEFYEEFKSKVPIHDYKKMYEEWWHKSKSGEADVCWPGVTEHFALSSGTSDSASKVIPVTKEMIKAIQRTSINQIISLGKYKTLPANLYEKGYLM
ncbi:MAG: GH3 auxin-responsive promoter family protein, partial [Spirosomaceae bacterium]|nr:GH3 auxin-responsive promoter family protein [Spirosomataceae bacterium]